MRMAPSSRHKSVTSSSSSASRSVGEARVRVPSPLGEDLGEPVVRLDDALEEHDVRRAQSQTTGDHALADERRDAGAAAHFPLAQYAVPTPWSQAPKSPP